MTPIILIMQLTGILLLACSLTLSAKTISQTVSLSGKNMKLDKVFLEITRQTGYEVACNYDLIESAKAVTIKLKNAPIDEFMRAVLKGQELIYSIEGETIFIGLKAADLSPRLDGPRPVFTSELPPIKVSGRVVDENGQPVSGASVAVRGSKRGTSTNAEGVFELSDISDNAVLIISGINIQEQEIKLSGQSFISVVVKQAVKEEEEVVVAYNKISQRSNVGAVTVVKGEQIENLPNRSVDKSLQGLVPGLLVTSGTGQPGGGLSNFVLRGIATNNGTEAFTGYSTLRNPLIVVDGMPVFQDAQRALNTTTGFWEVPDNNPMAHLNPSDIETISVLKDAAAIGLYGATASNGVILITTKKGKAGRTVFNIRSQVDIASRIKSDIELVTQEEYTELLYETYRNTTPGITDEEILSDLRSKFPVRSDGSFYPFTDLTPLLYKQKATTLSNELSMSGGNERSTYYLNLEWTDQDGIYRRTGFDRNSVRFNFNSKMTDWLKIGVNTGLSYNIQNHATGAAAQYGSIFYQYPLNPVYLENGDYYYNYTVPFAGTNPVAAVDLNSSKNVAYRGLSKFFAELSILKNLKFTSNVGIDFLLNEAKERLDPKLIDPSLYSAGVGRIQQASIRNANVISTNILSFNKTIGDDHGLNVLAGHEARLNTIQNLTSTGSYFQFNTADQISQSTTRTTEGSKTKVTGLSYFGQGNYDFKNKYFITASVRSDGYSQFGSKEPFNTFWSLGSGWIVSAERFLQRAKPWVEFLKIRASMGEAGNSSAINRYIKYQQLTMLNYLNPSTIGIFDFDSPPNTLIEPEKTFSWDAGLELKLLNNRIGATADVYRRKTRNLIFKYDLPLTSGFLAVQDNLGDIVNKGVELTISADIVRQEKFTWNINTNWSTNRNRLVKTNNRLPVTVSGTTPLANHVGRNFNSFYLREWAGVDAVSGMGMWIDSTGNPNTDYNAAKPQWVGKPQPDGFGAVTNTLSFREISFAFQLYYQYGFQVYNGDYRLINDGSTLFDNQEKYALNRWQKPGDISLNPKRVQYSPENLSTRYLFDGDHIRLQTISLCYKIPGRFIERIHLKSVSIYTQAHNLKLWSTKRTGTQDIGNVNIQGIMSFQYPQAKSYSIGINASF